MTFRHRIRYRFDNLLARGTGPALVWLGVVTLVAVLLSAALLAVFGVSFTGSAGGSWLEDFWQSLLRILDTGTMAGDIGWGRRILALVITLFGLLIAGTLIGIIAAGVEDRIDAMRRGRSVVIESDHLVILGGSSRLPSIIQQLVLANVDRARSTIVVLAETDPTELREAVAAAVPELLGTRVVYRSGDPTQRTDLGLVRISEARGAIVLSDAAQPDVAAVQTVLAITAELGEDHTLPIVVDLAEPTIAQHLVNACGPMVHPLVSTQAVARVAAFALRQQGLGKVVAELTDFRGCDLHVIARPEVVGLHFGQVVHGSPNSSPIGVFHPDGRIELDPPADTIITDDTRLIVIARDLAAFEVHPADLPPRDETQQRFQPEHSDEHIVVVGWNPLGSQVLGGWAAAATPSSSVDVVFDPRLIAPDEVVVPDLGATVRLHPTADLSSLTLEQHPTTLVLLGYTSVTPEEADARTLLGMMELKRHFSDHAEPPRMLVEMLDADHLDLAVLTGPDDFLISATLGSQFIAQLVEQPERRDVLLALYAGDGSSIRLIRSERLGLVGDYTAADVVARAYESGLLAIGWRLSRSRGSHLVLDPNTSARVSLLADDEIVVVG